MPGALGACAGFKATCFERAVTVAGQSRTCTPEDAIPPLPDLQHKMEQRGSPRRRWRAAAPPGSRYDVVVTAVVATLLIVFTALPLGDAFRCERRPKDVKGDPQPVNGRFRIEFSGKDNTYVPEHTYRVKLSGARHGSINKNTFRVFTLFLEPESFWSENGANLVGNLSTGGDSLITFGECANSIRQTSGRLKDSIEALWRAPPSGSGCVFFKATVVEDTTKWYMDDDMLTLHVCEEQQMNHNKQPEIQDPCCACDEAKYELTFEGLWSRHSHPKDFPKSWDTRFSDVIGASHAANYSFWNYLGTASPGLRQVAENGTTRSLEKELKDNSQHIRTIIKARGIGWPNVTGKTFAVFRVDRDHHLMSIVSHIDPSPDWFVGISGLELCLKNCSWIENIQFDLYPWDAGTNDGITYYSKGQETRNELIRQLTSSYPNNKDSPFFDPANGAEMKPIAKIYLTRQRLYEKFSCDSSHDNKNIDCATTPYTALGACSVTCGRGVRLQQREYLDPKKANDAFCNETLTRRFPCDKPPCPLNPWEMGASNNPQCETTEWSDWTPCPVCGGVQTRDRTYKYPEFFKICSAMADHPILQETLPCDPDPNITGCEEEEAEDIPKHCKLSHWSDWSPCSVTCGNGTRLRSGILVPRDHGLHYRSLMNRRHYEELDFNGEENEMDVLADGSEPSDCSTIKITQEMHCSSVHEDCHIRPDMAREICKLPKEEGPCRFQAEHWYFDTESGSCKPFNYGGCRGNRNNFGSQEICENICNSFRDDTDSPKGPFGGLSSYSHIHSKGYSEEETTDPEGDENDEAVDCKVSRWGPWSSCSVSCGEGFRHKIRKIEIHPSKNGKPCPKLRKKHKCRRPACDDANFANQMQSDENPTWGEARWIKSIPGTNCVLSEWSPWSSCTKSCGPDSRRIRTREVLVHPTPGGMPCETRIEYKYCAAIPCSSKSLD